MINIKLSEARIGFLGYLSWHTTLIDFPVSVKHKQNRLIKNIHDLKYNNSSVNELKKIKAKLEEEANSITSISKIENMIKEYSKYGQAERKIVEDFYKDTSNWSGAYRDEDRKAEIVKELKELSKTNKRNYHHVTVKVVDERLDVVRYDYYNFTICNSEIYSIKILRDRLNVLKAESKGKKGKANRLARIKERKYA